MSVHSINISQFENFQKRTVRDIKIPTITIATLLSEEKKLNNELASI